LIEEVVRKTCHFERGIVFFRDVLARTKFIEVYFNQHMHNFQVTESAGKFKIEFIKHFNCDFSTFYHDFFGVFKARRIKYFVKSKFQIFEPDFLFQNFRFEIPCMCSHKIKNVELEIRPFVFGNKSFR
jgi:hypothetical protein